MTAPDVLHRLAPAAFLRSLREAPATFSFRSMEEAYLLSGLLARWFPDSAAAHHGLCEMLSNAIEHGNLGIGYEEKAELLRTGRWQQEIAQRLQSDRWGRRSAEVTLEITPQDVTVIIRDEGMGFHWEPFLTLHPDRVDALNGRGIATSKLFAFTELQYRENGSEVRCTQKKRATSAPPFC